MVYYPRKNNWFKCNKCPNKIDLGNYIFISFRNKHGQIEHKKIKQPIVPYNIRLSQLVNTSTFFTGGQTLTYSNRPLNEIGYWYGAPGGYGQAPRNQFN